MYDQRGGGLFVPEVRGGCYYETARPFESSFKVQPAGLRLAAPSSGLLRLSWVNGGERANGRMGPVDPPDHEYDEWLASWCAV